MSQWTAAQVLDEHTSLCDRLSHPDCPTTGYMHGFAKSVFAKLGERGEALMFYPFHPRESETSAAEFYRALGRGLRSARTYQVSAEMVHAVTATYARTAAGVLHLEEAELPSERGFVWLDEPLAVTDASGRCLSERAFTWDTTIVLMPDERKVPAVRLSSFARVGDRDEVLKELLQNRQQGAVEEYERWLLHMGPLSLSHTMVVPCGERYGFFPSGRATVDGHPADNVLAWMHTLWMFLGSTVSVSARMPAGRPAARRALRHLSASEVHVVTLRRARHPASEEREAHREVDWSCRWFVQGHWRHVGSYAGDHHYAVARGQHCAACGSRLAWVRPYLKGPDSAPLKADPKQVHRLVR